MNVLVLDSAPTISLHSGKSIRLQHVLSRLGRRHRLSYLAITGPTDSDDAPSWLRSIVTCAQVWRRQEQEFRLGRYVNWVSLQPWFYAPWRYPADHRRLSEALGELVKREGIELIHCVDEEVAQFIPEGLGCPWIADPADAMSLHAQRRAHYAMSVGERWRWRSMAWRLGRYERWLVNRADATVFVSPVDAALYRTNGVSAHVRVIPNGVDTDYFVPSPAPRPPPPAPTLLFTGHMSFEPNRDAARYLVDEIMPLVHRERPDAVCAVAGADPTPDLLARHDGRSVTITGRVDDLRPFFEQAWVYVCPMRLGAGIKNKLLEAMAMERPIVTTPRGAEALHVEDGVQVRLAESREQIAHAIVELLRDEEQRQRLGRAGRAYVMAHHSWDRAADTYEALYQQLRDMRNGHGRR